MYAGRVTVRRVAVVASQLPPGSRVHQAETADEAWTPDQYHAANITDLLNLILWATVNQGVEKGKQSKQPEPADRPADHRRKRAQAVDNAGKANRFKQFFDRWTNGPLSWPKSDGVDRREITNREG